VAQYFDHIERGSRYLDTKEHDILVSLTCSKSTVQQFSRAALALALQERHQKIDNGVQRTIFSVGLRRGPAGYTKWPNVTYQCIVYCIVRIVRCSLNYK